MDGIIGCFGSLNLLNLLINKISKMDPVKPMGSGRATWINLLVLVLGRVFETIKIRTSQNAQVMILSTLWWFNIAIENGPFIDGLPIKNGEFL